MIQTVSAYDASRKRNGLLPKESKRMNGKYCQECGTALVGKYLENEGMIPFCPKCNQYRFPMYNVAVSMIVVNKQTDRILLIKQYGRPFFILVAGYVNRTEQLEHAVIREIKEETGMTVSSLRFNRTKFFEPSDTLMCNFTVFVDDDSELCVNQEVDAYMLIWMNELPTAAMCNLPIATVNAVSIPVVSSRIPDLLYPAVVFIQGK